MNILIGLGVCFLLYIIWNICEIGLLFNKEEKMRLVTSIRDEKDPWSPDLITISSPCGQLIETPILQTYAEWMAKVTGEIK